LATQNFRVKNGLEVGSNVKISSGIITATSFVGSGSQLTNLVANYSSVSGVSSYALLSGISSSVVGGAVSATSLTVTGVSTFEGAISVRNGYNLNIGDNNDLRIYNDGTDSRIEETGSGSLYISGSDINIQQHSTNKNFAKFVSGGAVELYYNDSKKFSTSGIGVTVTGTLVSDQVNISGIATAVKFVKNGATASNFLKANGDDSPLLSSEVTGALGYTPANSASVSGQYPVGNSIILDSFSSSFNGSLTDFTLASVGVAFTPTGSSANLVVSLGGVIQKPGTDYSIVQVGGANTNTIRFTTAPSSGLDCFVVGLGGQGALLSDVSWNAKGDMVIATGDNVASMLSVGANNNILIADSSAANGVKWGTSISNLTLTQSATVGSAVTINSSGINVSGIVTASSVIANETRILTGSEKVTRTTQNSITLNYNSASSNIAFFTSPSSDVTLNVVGIPTSSDFDDYSITFAAIVNSTGTARTCTAINLNGVSKTIRWMGGSLSNAISGVTTTNGHTIFNFTGINTVGSASTVDNYQVFGSASGGFY